MGSDDGGTGEGLVADASDCCCGGGGGSDCAEGTGGDCCCCLLAPFTTSATVSVGVSRIALGVVGEASKEGIVLPPGTGDGRGGKCAAFRLMGCLVVEDDDEDGSEGETDGCFLSPTTWPP